MRRSFLIIALLSTIACGTARADAPRYHLGRDATAADIAAVGISVGPDGTGLPPGKATAREGRPLFESKCASCHGLHGEGNAPYPPLKGGEGSLKSAQPILTIGSYWPYATTVWDYINRAMPYPSPGTLTSQEVYELTAYVLYLNGIVTERQVVDQKKLPLIRMPNRQGFIADPRPDVPEKSAPANGEPGH